jgi:hypothetical protein
MNLHSLLFLFMMACFGEKILAQNEWTGCVDPRNPTNSRVKIGDPTPVCLTVGPGGSWSRGVPYIRWMFTPKADEYSRFRIPNCKLKVRYFFLNKLQAILCYGRITLGLSFLLLLLLDYSVHRSGKGRKFRFGTEQFDSACCISQPAQLVACLLGPRRKPTVSFPDRHYRPRQWKSDRYCLG